MDWVPGVEVTAAEPIQPAPYAVPAKAAPPHNGNIHAQLERFRLASGQNRVTSPRPCGQCLLIRLRYPRDTRPKFTENAVSRNNLG